MPVSHSYVGHVSARYVVTGNAATCVTRSKPVLLDLKCKIKYNVILKKTREIGSFENARNDVATCVTRSSKPMLFDLKCKYLAQ